MTFTHKFTDSPGVFDILVPALNVTGWQRTTIHITISFSTFCLALSFITYSLIRDLRTFPGKCLMGLISSQIVTNILLLFAFNFSPRTFQCFLTGAFLHYTSLTTMYWMNVIGYDVMWRLLHPLAKRNDSHFKRFYIIVHIIPLMIVCPAIINEFYAPIGPSGGAFLKPDYGKIQCSISSWSAKLIYASIPVAISCFFNIVIFIMAIIRMRKITSELQGIEICVPPLSRRICYFGKLSLLLGISSMFGYLGVQIQNNVNLRFALCLYNSLSGKLYLFIFIFIHENL